MTTGSDGPRRKPRRPWKAKFGDAFRGVKLGVRGHSSFAVHFFMAALVAATAVALGCDWVEWSILLLCVGGVLTAELLNSAIETLFHGLDDATKGRLVGCLDISAGAVLVAAAFSGLVGCLVFGHRLWAIYRQAAG